MTQTLNPPKEEELNHLKSVVVGTFGPHNEVTNILERLIKQRDMAIDVCKRLSEYQSAILHKNFESASHSLNDLFRCAENTFKTPTLP